MIDRECPSCGKIYSVDSIRLKHNRGIACSRKCSYEYRAKSLMNKIDLVCDVCKKTFQRIPSQTNKAKHGGVFCSRECHYKGRSLGLVKRVVTKPYTYTPESKAAMIFSSRTPKGKRVFHWLTCNNCGKIFDDPKDRKKGVNGLTFCSLDCCNIFRSGENNPAWRGGYDRYYGPTWTRQRREARRRDNHTCQRCGTTRKEIGKELDVHHIKRFGDFADSREANALKNLITLCHSCHMQIEWDDNRKITPYDCSEKQTDMFLQTESTLFSIKDFR